MTPETNFNSDRPIQSASEDKLGRNEFARLLAGRILGWRGRESLVIAIYGDWGSGKSSVKNLVLEKLREEPKKVKTVVEFNPWLISGEEKITEAFFGEIANNLGSDPNDASSEKRARIWKTYARLLKVGAHLASTIDTALLLKGIPSSGVGKLMSDKLSEASGLADEAVEADQKELKSIEGTRSELRRQFQSMTDPLVVVIDDIDRLTADEIRLVFRLVKANADFPNFVYLLLFQRDTAEKALDDISNKKGREFLEKIVQVGFDLPAMSQSAIANIFLADLDKLLSPFITKQEWDSERWTNLWAGGITQYFLNVRNVYRFLNSLSFALSAFSANGVLEVNPIDLVGIECLRVFEPEVYAEIAKNSAVLTRPGGDRNGDLKVIAQLLLDKARCADTEKLKFILALLFPELGPLWGRTTYSVEFYQQWTADRRVCTPVFFRRYFALRLDANEISEATVQKILKNLENKQVLLSIFGELETDGLVDEALGRLEGEKLAENLVDPLPLLFTLVNLSDRLPVSRIQGFALPGSMRVKWIFQRALENLNNVPDRIEVVSKIINESAGLAFSLDLIIDAENPREGSIFPSIEGEAVAALKARWLGNVRDAAANQTLLEVQALEHVLQYWADWCSGKEVAEWLAPLALNTRAMFRLLKAHYSTVNIQQVGSHFARSEHWIPWENLQKLQPKEFWQEVVGNLLAVKNPSEEEKEVTSSLVDTLNRWAEEIDDSNYHAVERWKRTKNQ